MQYEGCLIITIAIIITAIIIITIIIIVIILNRPERIRRSSNYCNMRDPCADYLSNPMFNSLHQRGGIRYGN